eukprot:SAG31_NODE_4184_length_3494_cov_7.133432_2_plen_139_part_00
MRARGRRVRRGVLPSLIVTHRRTEHASKHTRTERVGAPCSMVDDLCHLVRCELEAHRKIRSIAINDRASARPPTSPHYSTHAFCFFFFSRSYPTIDAAVLTTAVLNLVLRPYTRVYSVHVLNLAAPTVCYAERTGTYG